ncbi:MAG: tetratricopeptide repeat protein [Verrucomicrobia subdivision 3 bacterium]|nr:tetratricopeptide repeat protein [Limisphaerales bacterium]
MRFLAWAQANQKRLIVWGGLAIVAIAAIAFVVYQQGQKEIRAALALSNVRVPLSPTAPVPPGTADAFLRVAKDYDGTKAAARAQLMGAATQFTEGNYAAAQKSFEEFLREYPESPWTPQAHFGIGASLDAQGKASEATAKFEEIRRRFASEPIIDEAKLALARLYENQGKNADAHKIYTELVTGNPYSGIGSEAGLRKEDLEAKYPDLAKTNAPIMTPPAPTATLANPPTTKQVLTITNIPQSTVTTGAAKATAATNLPPLNVKPSTNAPAAGAGTNTAK